MRYSRLAVFVAGAAVGAAGHYFASTSAPRQDDPSGGFSVSANFDNVGALQEGSRVALAGVTVGRVSAIEFDPRYFEAKVSMRIEARYDMIPADSAASIVSEGLFGPQYVSLSPGAAEAALAEGSQIQFTQSALVVEQLIGQFLFRQIQ